MQSEVENSCNRRLLALLHAGYAIKLSGCTFDTIDLRHPARRRTPSGEANLYLLPDGAVLTTKSDAGGFPVSITADDERSFNSLLSNVPKPTWWEVNQDKVIDRFVQVGLLAVLLTVMLYSRTN